VAVSGSSCTATGSGNARTGTVTLLAGDSATFTALVTLSASAAPGNLANSASVAIAAGDITVDQETSNNSATDTDAIVLPRPTLGLLDDFNRVNATTLGVNWVQGTSLGINANQANRGTATGSTNAFWVNGGTPFGSKQGAAFTFVQNAGSPSAPVNNSAILLKANGTTSSPTGYLRVRYQTGSGGQIVVAWTTNSAGGFTTTGTFTTGTWATGDTLTAVANADGSVDVWRNATYIGRSSAVATFAGTGRIGVQLSSGARIDDFSGQNVP
jgi:hypothetical protein